jgi:hypothetical protein
MNKIAQRSSGESHINTMKKKKDWFRQYFDKMKQIFRLKQNAANLAMEKVDRIIHA